MLNLIDIFKVCQNQRCKPVGDPNIVDGGCGECNQQGVNRSYHKAIANTVFNRIHAPPQIDAPPKFLDHIPEVKNPKSQVAIFSSELSAHECWICPSSSGIPKAARHHSDLDIIGPEYTHPSGYLGVHAGACVL